MASASGARRKALVWIGKTPSQLGNPHCTHSGVPKRAVLITFKQILSITWFESRTIELFSAVARKNR
jgi:hypothetical protein